MKRAVAGVLALAVVLAGCSLLPRAGSKGTMPPPGANGEVDPSSMPDFIAVAGDVGIVGWVEKAAVLDPSDRTWPVYGDDLRTVVGQMVPGRGFVPAGVDPNAVPTKPVQVEPASPSAQGDPGKAVVYVRNCSPAMAWIGVVSGGRVQGMGAAGYWPNGYIGSGDFTVAPGDAVAVLDRSPSEVGVVPRRSIYLRGASIDPAVRWVNLDTAGAITVGIGIPDWWDGGVNPAC